MIVGAMIAGIATPLPPILEMIVIEDMTMTGSPIEIGIRREMMVEIVVETETGVESGRGRGVLKAGVTAGRMKGHESAVVVEIVAKTEKILKVITTCNLVSAERSLQTV